MNQEKLYNEIVKHLESGGIVMVSTYTHARQYTKPAHSASFKLGKDNLIYTKRGKSWDCAAYCKFTFWTIKETES